VFAQRIHRSRHTRSFQMVCGAAALLSGAFYVQNSRAAKPRYVALSAKHDAVKGKSGPIVNLAAVRRNDPGHRSRNRVRGQQVFRFETDR
jgi:hypothetical protein